MYCTTTLPWGGGTPTRTNSRKSWSTNNLKISASIRRVTKYNSGLRLTMKPFLRVNNHHVSELPRVMQLFRRVAQRFLGFRRTMKPLGPERDEQWREVGPLHVPTMTPGPFLYSSGNCWSTCYLYTSRWCKPVRYEPEAIKIKETAIKSAARRILYTDQPSTPFSAVPYSIPLGTEPPHEQTTTIPCWK